jgi:hypothetical protein
MKLKPSTEVFQWLENGGHKTGRRVYLDLPVSTWLMMCQGEFYVVRAEDVSVYPSEPIPEPSEPDSPTCCRKHWEAVAGTSPLNPIGMPFIACKSCGNKRCPKATDCELACTGSNAPGQPGSIYAGGR